MTLTEPTTMVTDYILGIAGLVFGLSLLRSSAPSMSARLLWPLGFFCGGAAAIVGGTFHGFAAYQNATVHKALWDVTMLLIGASAAFMIAAACSGQLPRDAKHSRWLLAGLMLSIAGLVIQQGSVAIHPSFNHNDLYHCLQTVAFYFLFRGAQVKT